MLQEIKFRAILFVWFYSIVWSFIQDAGKVLNYKLLAKLGLVQDLGIIDENRLSSMEPSALEGENMGRPVSVSGNDGFAAGFVEKKQDRYCCDAY